MSRHRIRSHPNTRTSGKELLTRDYKIIVLKYKKKIKKETQKIYQADLETESKEIPRGKNNGVIDAYNFSLPYFHSLFLPNRILGTVPTHKK